MQQYDDKDPDSVEIFDWNFATLLRDGETIATVVGSAVDDATGSQEDTQLVLIGAPEQTTDDARIVAQSARGGTLGARYTIRCRVSTSLGQVLDLSGRVYIAQQ